MIIYEGIVLIVDHSGMSFVKTIALSAIGQKRIDKVVWTGVRCEWCDFGQKTTSFTSGWVGFISSKHTVTPLYNPPFLSNRPIDERMEQKDKRPDSHT